MLATGGANTHEHLSAMFSANGLPGPDQVTIPSFEAPPPGPPQSCNDSGLDAITQVTALADTRAQDNDGVLGEFDFTLWTFKEADHA